MARQLAIELNDLAADEEIDRELLQLLCPSSQSRSSAMPWGHVSSKVETSSGGQAGTTLDEAADREGDAWDEMMDAHYAKLDVKLDAMVDEHFERYLEHMQQDHVQRARRPIQKRPNGVQRSVGKWQAVKKKPVFKPPPGEQTSWRVRVEKWLDGHRDNSTDGYPSCRSSTYTELARGEP